jgi:hypothetical protein
MAHIDALPLLGCFRHFVPMCNSLTFLFHMDSTYFFFFHVSFGGFRQESYAGMWGHYGSKIVRIFSRPFNEALSSTTNMFSWYRFSLYGKMCPICFSRVLGSSGSVFVL